MPQVFVYIRNDDFDKWKAVEKKSEFVHNALNRLTVPGFSEVPTKDPLANLKADIKRIESKPATGTGVVPESNYTDTDWGA